jgi:hypothetical protein
MVVAGLGAHGLVCLIDVLPWFVAWYVWSLQDLVCGVFQNVELYVIDEVQYFDMSMSILCLQHQYTHSDEHVLVQVRTFVRSVHAGLLA